MKIKLEPREVKARSQGFGETFFAMVLPNGNQKRSRRLCMRLADKENVRVTDLASGEMYLLSEDEMVEPACITVKYDRSL